MIIAVYVFQHQRLSFLGQFRVMDDDELAEFGWFRETNYFNVMQQWLLFGSKKDSPSRRKWRIDQVFKDAVGYKKER